MTNCETFCDADRVCADMFPPQCGAGGIWGKPRLSSLSWRQLECWRRSSKLAELNGAKTDRTAICTRALYRTRDFPLPTGTLQRRRIHRNEGLARQLTEPDLQRTLDSAASKAARRTLSLTWSHLSLSYSGRSDYRAAGESTTNKGRENPEAT